VGEGERDIECRCESPKGHRIPSCEGACVSVCVSVRGVFRGCSWCSYRRKSSQQPVVDLVQLP